MNTRYSHSSEKKKRQMTKPPKFPLKKTQDQDQYSTYSNVQEVPKDTFKSKRGQNAQLPKQNTQQQQHNTKNLYNHHGSPRRIRH